MTFSQSLRTVFREKFAKIEGRASRSEFWWWMLFLILVHAVLGLFLFFGLNIDPVTDEIMPNTMFYIFIVLMIFWILATSIPTICVTVRRFHDRNLSGWWVLALCVAGILPFIGFIASFAQLVICCLPGTQSDNKFGESPIQG